MAALEVRVEKRKRILLVEDERVSRLLLERKLQTKYEIESASDSQTALQLLQENPSYDYVVADLRIPEKEGRGSGTIEEGLRVLQAIKDQIPCAVYSNHLGEENVLQRVNALGPLGVFDKLTQTELLLKSIDAYLKPATDPQFSAVDTETLLARARERGRSAQEYLLTAEGGTLSESDVAQLLHLSIKQVEEHRRAGRLIGLPSAQDMYAYPVWQFQADGMLPGLEDVLEDLRDHDPWMQAHFFLSEDIRLNSETPLAELRRGHLEAVRRAARAYGEQCAA